MVGRLRDHEPDIRLLEALDDQPGLLARRPEREYSFDSGGQVENYSANVAGQVLDGGNADFVCLDPAVNNLQGHEW